MEWVAALILVPPLMVIAGITLWYLNVGWRRERLDDTWGWVGPGRQHHGSGRAWHGEVSGREIEVTWFDRNTTVRLEADPKVEVGFGRAGGPHDTLHTAGPDAVEVPLPNAHVAYGPSPEVVRRVAEQPGVQPALYDLLDTPVGPAEQPAIRTVEVARGGVTWFGRNLRDRQIERDDAHRWVEALLVLAHAAEA
jgi:hypothetical protein